MRRLCVWLLHLLIVRPLVWGLIGVNLRGRERLPRSGPAIIVANHNSHLDTLLLMAVLPLRLQERIRPVAASEYFFGNRWLRWLARALLGVIPLKRGGYRASDGDPLAECRRALDRGGILILYPEGTRGEPERLCAFKTGIAHLASRHPHVPVIPVFLRGPGKVLPKGSVLPVPFVCDVQVGRALAWTGERCGFMERLRFEFARLGATSRSSRARPIAAKPAVARPLRAPRRQPATPASITPDGANSRASAALGGRGAVG
jgi:1-acyl-sn-glycerol-3-phosphate acyltransferase